MPTKAHIVSLVANLGHSFSFPLVEKRWTAVVLYSTLVDFMHARRGIGDHFHRVRRQGLEGLLGELIPTASTQSNPLGDFTTLLDGATSIIVFPSTTTSSHTTTTTTSTTSSTTSSHSTALQTLVPQTPTTTTTPIPTPTSASSDYGVYSVTSGTSIVYVTTTMAMPSTTSAAPKSFLQNPTLEGGVFTAVGVVVLILVFVVVTWTLRKRRHDRTKAITFDPGMTEHYVDTGDRTASLEKRRFSGSSSGHVHGLPYMTPQQIRTPQINFPPQAHYQSFVPPPPATHRQPTPIPPVPPHPPYNPSPSATQEPDFNCNPDGGASLTRKYSDRKPVPPLLPNPVYDPSRRFTLPQQFCPSSPVQPASQAPEVISGHAVTHEALSVFTEPELVEEPYTGVLMVVNQ